MLANSMPDYDVRAWHTSPAAMEDGSDMGFHWSCADAGSNLSSQSISRKTPSRKVHKVHELFGAYQLAKLISDDGDEAQTKAGFIEAVRFLDSGIFPDYVRPNVSVDQYGEFSFSISTQNGYLDIGVNGDGILSYHVRNDKDPQLSVFGDDEWDSRSVPDKLIEGVIWLLQV